MNRRGFLTALLALPATPIVSRLLGNLGGQLPEQVKALQVTVANSPPMLPLTLSEISAARVRARIDELPEQVLLSTDGCVITVQNPRLITLSYASSFPGLGYDDWPGFPRREGSASFEALATRQFKEALDVARIYAAGRVTIAFGPSDMLGAPLALAGDVVAMEFTDYARGIETYVWRVELSNVSEVVWI